MEIKFGLDEKYKEQMVELFFETLGEKVIPVLGNGIKSRKLYCNNIDLEKCIFAVENNTVLGFLAFQNSEGNFFDFGLREIISIYGPIKGFIKALILSTWEHKVSAGEIYIDSLAVNESARGKKIGTKLIDCIENYAKQNNYKKITLDVIGINIRAKKLYERIGFKVTKEQNIYPLNKLMGVNFTKIIAMEKIL